MKNKKWKMHFVNSTPCRWDGDDYNNERNADDIYELTLEYSGYGRGNSSAVLYFIGENNKGNVEHYQVFLSDLEDIINHTVNGSIKGKFKFVKKGRNYGLKLVESCE
jgi:hypothetical protein